MPEEGHARFEALREQVGRIKEEIAAAAATYGKAKEKVETAAERGLDALRRGGRRAGLALALGAIGTAALACAVVLAAAALYLALAPGLGRPAAASVTALVSVSVGVFALLMARRMLGRSR